MSTSTRPGADPEKQATSGSGADSGHRVESGQHAVAGRRAEPGHWAAYNSRQFGRPVRELCLRAMALADRPSDADAGSLRPAAGTEHRSAGERVAVDLGCGAGRETAALLSEGWSVLAHDSEPDTEARILRTVGGIHSALTVRVCAFEELSPLPDADLVYAGYSLPFQTRTSFDRTWSLIRAALRPGARLAVNVFGERDSWAADPAMTFLPENELRTLLDGLEIEHWHEEDAPGPAFSGPKHWHVFDVIARNPH
ncbi:methyltransferase [Actinoplanes sp. OR16]|uniref:class I SAM-dependent methyltransferase n=1 Tax=Actinoplanes sp. OR16 TaxID=946334 RepID=UPI000F711B8F|nr:class I SAM-dependent methyltransferase [Actinoplanes sp. OR16]BBH65886.1 methyltransferase [Actinoplanes sp. OR16]